MMYLYQHTCAELRSGCSPRVEVETPLVLQVGGSCCQGRTSRGDRGSQPAETRLHAMVLAICVLLPSAGA